MPDVFFQIAVMNGEHCRRIDINILEDAPDRACLKDGDLDRPRRQEEP